MPLSTSRPALPPRKTIESLSKSPPNIRISGSGPICISNNSNQLLEVGLPKRAFGCTKCQKPGKCEATGWNVLIGCFLLLFLHVAFVSSL